MRQVIYATALFSTCFLLLIPTSGFTQLALELAPKEESKLIEALKSPELKEGMVFTIEQLFFKADSDDIDSKSFALLDELAKVLNQRTDIKKIEISGHTNGLPPAAYCDKLSTARAQQIYHYLSNKNVDVTRLEYKGYGKNSP